MIACHFTTVPKDVLIKRATGFRVRKMGAAWIGLMISLALILSAIPASAASYLQCVPFARELSGVQIYGNAHTWWSQAAGRYDRGKKPRVGAVMAFRASSAMPLGHVAVVSKIKNTRELLISHANWSPINGRRGQIERNVLVLDVSDANDWSAVRVWYAPTASLGVRTNPLNGFIYLAKPGAISSKQADERPGRVSKISDSKATPKLDKKAAKAKRKADERAADSAKDLAKQAARDQQRRDKAAAKAVGTMQEKPKAKDKDKAKDKAKIKPAAGIETNPAFRSPSERALVPAKAATKPATKPAAIKPAPAKAATKPATKPAASKSRSAQLDAVMARLTSGKK